jgi:hypothetical protein
MQKKRVSKDNIVVQVDDLRSIKIDIQQRLLAQSDRHKILDLRLRIITYLNKRRYFVERSIGSLLDLERAMAVRFNPTEFPVSHYNLPRLRIQSYIKDSMDKRAMFSTVDLKLMTGNCSTYLNMLACKPVFMVESLRTFLGLNSANFREVDIYIRQVTQDEASRHKAMQSSLMADNEKFSDDSAKDIKASSIELRDKFAFKGVDRRRSAGEYRYNLFCTLGESKWYSEKTVANLAEFIHSLNRSSREDRDSWQRYPMAY